MEANPQYKQDRKEYMWTEAKEQGQFSSTLESIALICLYSYIKLAIYLVFFFFWTAFYKANQIFSQVWFSTISEWEAQIFLVSFDSVQCNWPLADVFIYFMHFQIHIDTEIWCKPCPPKGKSLWHNPRGRKSKWSKAGMTWTQSSQ